MLIFLLTYILISVQRLPVVSIDRPTGSLIGAVLMILLGVVSFEDAIGAIDFKTIVLLLGMMVLVTYLAIGGFLDFVSIRIVQLAKNPFQLLVFVVLSSGILSSLFVNDTIVLIYTPILIRAVKLVNLKPTPYLIALATSANIGSVATIVGNPQNMLIGVQSGIPFQNFATYMTPVALGGLIINILIVAFVYRKDIFDNSFQVVLPPPKLDTALLKKSLVVLAFVLLGFIVGENYITIPMAAITGAALMFLIGGKLPVTILRRLDWSLLFFFANLFIVMHGVEASGLTDLMFNKFQPLFEFNGLGFIWSLSTFSLIVSNLVSNVPFVMMMLPFAGKIGHGDIFWYTLAMSSTFAGNLTIIGSVCNMIVVEISKRAKIEISFLEFFKVGSVVTILTILVGSLILSLY